MANIHTPLTKNQITGNGYRVVCLEQRCKYKEFNEDIYKAHKLKEQHFINKGHLTISWHVFNGE